MTHTHLHIPVYAPPLVFLFQNRICTQTLSKSAITSGSFRQILWTISQKKSLFIFGRYTKNGYILFLSKSFMFLLSLLAVQSSQAESREHRIELLPPCGQRRAELSRCVLIKDGVFSSDSLLQAVCIHRLFCLNLSADHLRLAA